MTNKTFKGLVLGLVFSMGAGWASATPITWVFSGLDLIGSFYYDTDVGGSAGYSSVNFEELYFYDLYDSVEATSTSLILNAISIEYGDATTIYFSSELTNNIGEVIAFSATTVCSIDCEGDNSYEFFGSVTSVPAPMPEPGILALLGLGLAGIGISRRRKK